MKKCATCGGTYMDRVDFCFEDGSVLSSATVEGAGDPQDTGWEVDAPMPGNLVMGVARNEIIEDEATVSALQFTPSPPAPSPRGVGYMTESTPVPVHIEPPTQEELNNANTLPPPVRRSDEEVSAPILEEDVSANGKESDGRQWLFFAGVAATTVTGLAIVGGLGSLFMGYYYAQTAAKDADGVATVDVVPEVVPEDDGVLAPEAPTNVDSVETVEEPEEPIDTDVGSPEDSDTDVPDEIVVGTEEPQHVENTEEINVDKKGEGDLQPTADPANPASNAGPGLAGREAGFQGRPLHPVVAPKGREVVPKNPKAPSVVVGEAKPDLTRTNGAPDVEKPQEPTADIEPTPKPEPARMVNVLLRRPGLDGKEVNLLVDGKQAGAGSRWPLRLQLAEGAHEFVVFHDGAEMRFTKTVAYQSSMLMLSLQ